MNKLDKENNHFLGSGWAFPVRFSSGNGLLLLTEYEKNINDSIDIILQTNQGERIMEPKFGSGLQQFFFRKMDSTLKGEIKDVVKLALLNNEPRIFVKNVQVDFVDISSGQISITIEYIYNQTNTRHNYVFPYHLKEGTNL